MKKIKWIVLVILGCIVITGCGHSKKADMVDGNLSDLIDQVYQNISKDELPMLTQTEVTKENMEYYLGTTDLNYKEALASEPAMSSIAHSVVMVRMNSVADVEQAKKEIQEKVNPRKWICVEVDQKHVLVESRGDLIILIMDNTYADTIRESFLKL